MHPYYDAHLILALHYYSFEYILTGVANQLSLNPLVPLGLGFVYLVLSLCGAWWEVAAPPMASTWLRSGAPLSPPS